MITVLLLQVLYAYTQSMLTGVVIDCEDNKPVQYVSIGVTRTRNGTVSNVAGLIKLPIMTL